MHRVIGFLLLVTLIAPQFLAAQIDEEVQVNLMEIWVKATNRSGQPVMDLDPTDFHVMVDGRELPVRCFDKSLPGPSDSMMAESSSVETSAKGRRFILFFDMLNTMPGDMDYLKLRLQDYLRTAFRENDQAMVFALLPNYRLGLVQNWTSDRFSLLRVIDRVRGNMTLKSTLEANETQLLHLLYQPDTTNDGNPGQARGIGGRPQEGVQQARQLARNLASQDASRSRLTLDAFLSIASYLSGFPFEERPVLLYISGGFPLNPGQFYYELVQKAVEDQYEQGPGNLSIIERPSLDFQNEVRNVMGRLNRLNVTIYSIDAKGLPDINRGADRTQLQVSKGMNLVDQDLDLQDSLVLVARETGGTAVINTQDYLKGLADIAGDLQNQYFLCVDLPATAKRGVYHRIEVKVDRPGVSLRHRKGYME